MPSFLRLRKVHEVLVLQPEVQPLAREAADCDPAWYLRQCAADRADARAVVPWRVGLHPLICVGPGLDRVVEAVVRAARLTKLKQGDRSLVVRLARLEGAESLGSVVLKHYLPGRLWDPRDACGQSKAIRSLLAARALQRRGFRVARPLAAWSSPGQGSHLLLQDLEHHLPLHEAVTPLKESDRRVLLADFAGCLRRLHAAGVAYRDLKPSNVMVAPGPGDRFAFIDHDRNRFFGRPVPRRLAGRDLAAVNAGLPPIVRASERWQALRAYDPQMVEQEPWQQWVRPILRESAQRRHRWIARRLLGGA